MNLTAGTSLHNGKYILSQALGQAEFGITYRATSTQTDQPVVIKTLNQELQHHADFAKVRQRFLEEAHQLKQCQHPNLVKTLDVFEESGLPFLVTEHATGQTLADLVKSNGAFAESPATHAIRQVAAALRVLHQHQLLHRGVKPKNLIQCDRTGFVILTDFGIAQGVGSAQESKHLSAGYAALEQYYPKVALMPATDVYGLAATFFYLLTGTTPPAAPMRDRMPAPSLRQSQPNINSALEQAILQGMAIEATLRPQSIEAWLALLPNPFVNPSMNGASKNGTNGAVSTSATTVLTTLQSSPSSVATTHSTAVVAPQATASTASATSPTVAIPATSPSVQLAPSTSPSHWLRVLGFASVVAGLIGVGSGFAIRFSGGSSPGSTLFNTEQNFPPSDKWPGTPLPDETEPVADPVDRTPLQAYPEPEPITRQAEPIAPPPQPSPSEEVPVEPDPPVIDPSLSTPAPSVEPVAPPNPAPVAPPTAIDPPPAPAAAPPQAPPAQAAPPPQAPPAQSGAN